ncbi:hypothetical protein LCGC14_0466950 [marine sediment metagenome]|uniref:Uncharacterized protein n=1 Tax=marine sediment metagenome TaxID=412755 RepID=A0A0F9SDI7_9ZZZZ
MKKPKLSEIYSLMASSRPLEHKEGCDAIMCLLDLVKRLGKVIDATTVWCGDDPCYRTRNGVPQRMPAFAERIMKGARALLLEVKE